MPFKEWSALKSMRVQIPMGAGRTTSSAFRPTPPSDSVGPLLVPLQTAISV
jgi:hypothetical protein